jgi:hypothetical protein
MIVRYVCPEHKNVVLFTEDLEVTKYMIMERPQYCPECKKSYYKSECDTKYEGTNSENER